MVFKSHLVCLVVIVFADIVMLCCVDCIVFELGAHKQEGACTDGLFFIIDVIFGRLLEKKDLRRRGNLLYTEKTTAQDFDRI